MMLACKDYQTEKEHKNTGLSRNYHKENEYPVSGLILLPEEETPAEIWGQWLLWYIKEHKRLFYVNLLTEGKSSSYLADINE